MVCSIEQYVAERSRLGLACDNAGGVLASSSVILFLTGADLQPEG